MRTYELHDLLKSLVETKQTRLYIRPGLPPEIKVYTSPEMREKLALIDDTGFLNYPFLDSPTVKDLAYSILTADQKYLLEKDGQLSFYFSIVFGDGIVYKFLANINNQAGEVSASYELVNETL
jgi:Tfp pilus assembly ATPase PilU